MSYILVKDTEGNAGCAPHIYRSQIRCQHPLFNYFHDLKGPLVNKDSTEYEFLMRTFSALSQYSSLLVNWLRYLSSSWMAAISAVVTTLLGSSTGVRIARLTSVVGSPKGVLKAGMSRSAISLASSR